MAAARQQVQGSLWGRLTARKPALAKRSAAVSKTVAVMPTHRALTAKDALYTVDGQGRRVYVPLTVANAPGGTKWAGRCWCHCGEMDGVLLVAWGERDDVRAVMRWRTLAEGDVRVIVGGQPG